MMGTTGNADWLSVRDTSERRLMREIQVSLSDRWFLGLDLEAVGDHDGDSDSARPHSSRSSRASVWIVIYQVDGTGFTGYWLRARVVNGDGLVNSWEYRRRLLRDDLAGYLEEIGATYLLTNGAGEPDPLLAWHGLVVPQREARPAFDAGPTRNPMARFRLFAIGHAFESR